jgi:putative ABC transport system ATP-binding protein
LSQGERQRVAICRALVAEPDVVLCDEPTGNLDPRTRETVIDLLFREAARRNCALVMVTHDHSILSRFSRVIDAGPLGRVGAGVGEQRT